MGRSAKAGVKVKKDKEDDKCVKNNRAFHSLISLFVVFLTSKCLFMHATTWQLLLMLHILRNVVCIYGQVHDYNFDAR